MVYCVTLVDYKPEEESEYLPYTLITRKLNQSFKKLFDKTNFSALMLVILHEKLFLRNQGFGQKHTLIFHKTVSVVLSVIF